MPATTKQRRTAWILAAVVLLGAVLRLAHVDAVGDYYSPHVEQEEGYYEAGVALLSCRALAQIPDTTPSSFRAPLYPAFHALVEAFHRAPSPRHVRLAQALLSVLAVAAAGLLGWLLFSPLAGILAAALLALNVEDILSVAALNVHSFYGTAMLALGAAAVLWLERRDLKRSALLGLMLAATLLCRPANFPFPLLFAGACLWLWRFPEGRWRPLLSVAAFTALFLAPVAVRNGLQFGQYSPFDLKGSYVLLRSTDGPHLRTTVEQALDVAEAIEPGFKARGLDGRPLHQALVGLAVRQIFRAPARYAAYCLERLYLYWRGLWLFLLLGAYVLWRRRGDRPLQALALTAASLSGYAVAGGAEEYRASAVPLLCVVAGAALASLPRAARGPAAEAPAKSMVRAGVAVLPASFAVIYAAMAVFLSLELRDNFRPELSPGPRPGALELCSDGRALGLLELGMRQAGLRGPAGVFYDNMMGVSLADYSPVGPRELTRNHWLSLAETEAAAGERDAAIASLARAEASNPGYYLSRRIIGLYRALRESRRAAALLDRLLRERPHDAVLWIERAEIEAASGSRPAALRFLAKAEASAPDAGVRRRIAALYSELKDFSRAAASLGPLLERDPRGASLLIERAALEARKGEKAAALASLEKASRSHPDRSGRRRIVGLFREMKEYRRAGEYLKVLLANDARDAGLWLERAEIAALTGERGAALRALSSAEGAEPDASALRRIVALYRELKEYRRASALLRSLLERQPQDPGLWLERAELEARSGSRAAALESLSRALSPAADDAVRRRAAALYSEIGDLSRASALLKELLARSPEDAGLWLDRAELEARSGAKDSARRSLARAQSLPDAADLDGERRRRAAHVHQALGEHGRCVAVLTDLTRRFPDEGAFHADKGLCEYLGGDARAAVASLETAIRLEPKFIPAYLTLGAIHAAKGRREEALKVYDEGLARSPAQEGDPLRKVLEEERRAAAGKGAGVR